MPRTTSPLQCRSRGRRGTRHCDVGEGGGAAGRRAGEEERAVGAAAAFRRTSGDAAAGPEKRMALQHRQRWQRRRSALRQGGRDGWRWYSGGNATASRRGRVSSDFPTNQRRRRGR
uniref:Uncharacterized protein n=1 Tax=Oryza glaberrima TaxID=4538 RepID=I1QZL9_ORYGL